MVDLYTSLIAFINKIKNTFVKTEDMHTAISVAIEQASLGTFKYQGKVATYADLPTNCTDANMFFLWAVEADGHGYYWFDNAWNLLDADIDLSNYITNSELSTAVQTINATLNSKVDKISGKNLSTEDYTTTDKSKLDSIANEANNYVLPTATANTLGGIKLTYVSSYGVCDTAANIADKVVYIDGFVLFTGAKIVVHFTNTSTATPCTLNVNGTGAKSVRYGGANLYGGWLSVNRTFSFIYDGAYWQLEGTTDTSYYQLTVAEAVAGDAVDARTVSPKVFKDALNATIYAYNLTQNKAIKIGEFNNHNVYRMFCVGTFTAGANVIKDTNITIERDSVNAYLGYYSIFEILCCNGSVLFNFEGTAAPFVLPVGQSEYSNTTPITVSRYSYVRLPQGNSLANYSAPAFLFTYSNQQQAVKYWIDIIFTADDIII